MENKPETPIHEHLFQTAYGAYTGTWKGIPLRWCQRCNRWLRKEQESQPCGRAPEPCHACGEPEKAN